MTKFSYKAQTKSGKIIKGEAESSDKFTLARELKKKGSFLISVKKVTKKKSNFLSFLTLSFTKIKMEERILFTRNLGSMIEAGLPLTRALSVLQRQTKNDAFKKVLATLSEEIFKGNELHLAMSRFPKVFSSLTVAMVKAGQKSGKIAESLKIIGHQLEQSFLLQKRIRGALIYPTIIIIAMIIVGVLMLLFVVPTLTATFTELGVELPTSTKILIGMSDFLRNNAFLSLVGFVGGIFLLVSGLKTPRGKRIMGEIILRLPIIGGLVREVNSARTARTLSSLLSSGVDIIEALTITEEVLQNARYKKILKEAQEKVQKGVALSVVFTEHEDLYPVLVGEMVAVGEETGKLSQMLMNVASFYEESISQATKDLSTIIEPILMVIIGTSVGFFAISMITPLYTVLGGL